VHRTPLVEKDIGLKKQQKKSEMVATHRKVHMKALYSPKFQEEPQDKGNTRIRK